MTSTTKKREQHLDKTGLLCGLDNDVLASLCISYKECLELKIDNIFFLCSKSVLIINQITFNVVFAVRSPLPTPVKTCYQNLSLAISQSLLNEEVNSQYLTIQSKVLIDIFDKHQNTRDTKPSDLNFAEALEKCHLAQELKVIYESIKRDGIVDILINNSNRLSFCLPHLAYNISEKCEQTHFVQVIFDAIKHLRPYFGILLLTTKEKLIQSLPFNCNYNTLMLIEIYNPRYSLARYAAELDVSLDEIFSIVDHLIYWAKVKITYPISESNVYVINPECQIHQSKNLIAQFSTAFDKSSFHYVLSLFSYPKTLADHLDPCLSKEQQSLFVDMVIWLLQRNVLMQLHTYIYLLPAKVTHKRLTADDTSETMSESIIEETPRPNKDGTYGDSADPTIAALGSRDLTAMFEGFRSAFAENAICEKDQQLILKALEHKSPSDIRLFMQLLPYFNGVSNLEAIIYFEHTNRSELLTLLDKCKELLVTSVYEDSNPIIRINSMTMT